MTGTRVLETMSEVWIIKPDGGEEFFAKEEEPSVRLLGIGELQDPVEDALKGAKAGEEFDVVLEPNKDQQKGTPTYETHLVEWIKPSKILAQTKGHPQIGQSVVYNGIETRIAEIKAGRIKVDGNPPLAGKTIRLHLKVVRVLEDPADIARAILKREVKGATPVIIAKDGFLEITDDGGRLNSEQRMRIVAVLRPPTGMGVRFVEEHVAPT